MDLNPAKKQRKPRNDKGKQRTQYRKTARAPPKCSQYPDLLDEGPADEEEDAEPADDGEGAEPADVGEDAGFADDLNTQAIDELAGENNSGGLFERH